jgi:DNA-binding NarL/FixJ family response regulator
VTIHHSFANGFDDRNPEQSANSHCLDVVPTFCVIDSRRLAGESLVRGLQSADASALFMHYTGLTDWSESDNAESPLVLLYVSGLSEAENRDMARRVQLLAGKKTATAFIVMSDREDVAFVMSWLQVGVRGFVPTSLRLAVVVQVLRLVRAGGVFVPSTVVLQMSKSPIDAAGSALASPAALSSKEALVAKEVRLGTPNKLIAYRLNMCESTVKVHVRNIMRKMNAKNRTQIACLTDRYLESPDAGVRAP